MSSLGSTTAATPAPSSPTRYEAQPRSSWVIWRKIMSVTSRGAVSSWRHDHRNRGRDRNGGRRGGARAGRARARRAGARAARARVPRGPHDRRRAGAGAGGRGGRRRRRPAARARCWWTARRGCCAPGAAAGVAHHVGVSIVGIDRVGGPYYRAKLAQEAEIRRSGVPWTIVRATQFHTLVARTFAASARLGVVPVVRAPLQPVDPREVGRALADTAEAEPSFAITQFAGPEVRQRRASWRGAGGRRPARTRCPCGCPRRARCAPAG